MFCRFTLMASAPTLASSTKETTNYARLCRLLVDGGTKALRYTFGKFHSPANLSTVLKANHSTLQSLKNKKIINATQWGKLYPSTPLSVTSEDFDITLLIVLLRNICHLAAPATGWDGLPPASDTSIEANLARVKYYRNTVYGHALKASVDDPTFNSLWQDISAALIALGVDAAAMKKLKTDTMDPDTKKHFRELLKEWKKDEDNIKDQLDKMEGMDKYCLVPLKNKCLFLTLIGCSWGSNESFELAKINFSFQRSRTHLKKIELTSNRRTASSSMLVILLVSCSDVNFIHPDPRKAMYVLGYSLINKMC